MRRKLSALAVLALLTGCGGNATDSGPRSFDLGTTPPSAKFPALRVASRAVAPFEGAQMFYRLSWRNPAELGAYANSQWAAPPAELLRKQVIRAAGEGVGKCALELEIQEFTQVFTAKDASEARIEARVSLSNGTVRIGSRGLTAIDTNAGAEAASGAVAIARATEQLMQELAGWVSKHPACV